MMSNTAELQYGECCCCLEKGDHRELTKQCYFNKQPEIYEVLFKDTFDIVLKYPENTKSICDCCIAELKQANKFRTLVERSQQNLNNRAHWQPEFVNVKENPLGPLNTEIYIKCDPDNQMEEELIYNVEETLVKEENSVIEEPSLQINTDCIKQESDDDMEDEPTADHLNIQHHSDPSTTSSNNLADTSSHIYEQLIPYDSNCQYKSAMKIGLNKFLRTDIKEKQFTCHFCQYNTASRTYLAAHVRTHTGEKPFYCDVCHYRTAHKGDLSRHLFTHTGKNTFFSCDICQYKTIRKETLSRHIRVHTGEKPFSCDSCQYKSAYKGALFRHKRTHTKENIFYCDICQYKTSEKRLLIMHIRTHTGELYSCDVCQYRTVQKVNLTRHVRTHTGKKKKFPCDVCQYKATRKEHLTRHMRTHTGEKLFSCNICQYRCARKEHITKHMHTHTAGKSE